MRIERKQVIMYSLEDLTRQEITMIKDALESSLTMNEAVIGYTEQFIRGLLMRLEEEI
jgi:hypothetical protein